MKLYLYGHDYKYAVEQMLLTMLPSERVEYSDSEPLGDRLEISLIPHGDQVSALCLFYENGNVYKGEDSIAARLLSTPLLTDRYCQRLIKNAMYRAFLDSGRQRPPWGSLTGVRPGKVFSRLLDDCGNEQSALERFMDDYDVSPARAALCRDTTRETLKAARSLSGRDVCLYIGIPFCPTRCAYCSFVSQSVEQSMKLIEPFLGALHREIDAVAAKLSSLGLRPVSVYFGGGTPTTLSAPQLDDLCSHLEQVFDFSALREYTVEAGRPDTITRDKLEVLRRHGVDRLSVNPQTMSDSVLEVIGRRHTAADIVRSLETVRTVGGFSVNMDLIAGLPSDTVEGFAATLDRVLALAPENITVHTLSLKKGSRIMLEGAELPDAAQVGEMLDIACSRLSAAGYAPYYLYRQKFMSGGFENVGWAKPGCTNLYNICIMEELCSIIAMGGGGSTKLVSPGGGRNIRITEPKYPLEYINNSDSVCAGKEKITEFYTQNQGEEE